MPPRTWSASSRPGDPPRWPTALGHERRGRRRRPDQLRPGDCLAGPNLGLGTSRPWPDEVTAVPCAQSHLAEVVFAGQAWPRSAAYPGDDAIGQQSDDRCDAALAGYTGGNPVYVRDFVVESIVPVRATWAGGDRSLACVTYEFTPGQPGGTRVSYSIRARQH
jgi:Septum formation